MPQWLTWTGAYNAQQAGLVACYTDVGTNAGNEQADASLHYSLNQDHAAIGHLISCVGYVRQAMFDLLQRDTANNPIFASLWLWKYLHDNAGTPSMDDILTAMLTATYDQLTKFIGIEDAYRSAIWDQPFNAEFYAALANGFRP